MSFEVQWLVEGYIVQAVLDDHFSPYTIAHFDQKMLDHLNLAQGERVHVIWDGSRSMAMMDFRYVRQFTYPHHNRFGWGLLVGAGSNPLLRMTTAVMMQLSRNRFREYDTLNEALTFLYQSDERLPRPDEETPTHAPDA